MNIYKRNIYHNDIFCSEHKVMIIYEWKDPDDFFSYLYSWSLVTAPCRSGIKYGYG
jgi:hypothetical protein